MEDDYIKSLSDTEKTIFLKIFCKLIKTDGVVDLHEVIFLKTFAQRYHVDGDTMLSLMQNSDLVNCAMEAHKIKNRQHALELIKEMCILVNIDNEAHDKELDLIIEVANAMGIEDEKVILIDRWVLDCAILMKTGRVIMERNNG